ncbi:hypothetical protein HOY80DRAFT_1023538 [Tuber brumale]|nr:hypothetical protein HOY80DRAFT_1023538 [Tuber brumale]
MDHRAQEKFASGGTSSRLTTHELRLVSFDKFGKPQPTPAELGDLPLYLDEDGYYSVNAVAPADPGSNSTIQPLINDISGFSCGSLRISPSHPHHYLGNDTTSGGSRASSGRRSYFCGEPDCAWKLPFLTKQALDRHREVKHLNIRVDCPIPGCKKVEDKGIKRKDNLPAHVLKKHGIKLPHQSRGN